MKGSDFIFDYFHLLYYKCLKSKLWWMIICRFSLHKKQKTPAINPINKKDNKCFQYAVTVALNHKEIKGIHFQNLEGINFPSEKEDWKKLEKNNVKVAHNILYAKTKNISCLCFET